jgi:hypothetical protein
LNFINKRMFALICNGAVGIRLPASTAANLQFSNRNASPFQPKGIPSTREWVQLNHEDSASYEQDRDLFLASIEFVKAGRARQGNTRMKVEDETMIPAARESTSWMGDPEDDDEDEEEEKKEQEEDEDEEENDGEEEEVPWQVGA